MRARLCHLFSGAKATPRDALVQIFVAAKTFVESPITGREHVGKPSMNGGVHLANALLATPSLPLPKHMHSCASAAVAAECRRGGFSRHRSSWLAVFGSTRAYSARHARLCAYGRVCLPLGRSRASREGLCSLPCFSRQDLCIWLRVLVVNAERLWLIWVGSGDSQLCRSRSRSLFHDRMAPWGADSYRRY